MASLSRPKAATRSSTQPALTDGLPMTKVLRFIAVRTEDSVMRCSLWVVERILV